MTDKAWIRTIEAAEAEGTLSELFTQITDPRTGDMDHILQVHGLHPAGLSAHLALYQAVMRGTPTLHKVDRELIAFVVSTINACHY
jgi:alkylhydroperoxidase family enzyme